MDSNTFAEQLLPLLGGTDNIVRQTRKENCFLFTVKDSGAVQLNELRQSNGVASAELSRGRVRVTAQDNFVEGNIMAKGGYKELSEKIFDLIGGKDNIVYFQHCTTRLRFNLEDQTNVDVESIKKIKKVLGCQWSNNELQVVIGPAVADAYDEICEVGGLAAEKPVDENLDPALKSKKPLTVKSVLMGILDGISGSITPVIPMMIGGGMVKVVTMILNLIGVLPSDSSTYTILSWLGDAFMYFFPVFLGGTSAKKFFRIILCSHLLP